LPPFPPVCSFKHCLRLFRSVWVGLWLIAGFVALWGVYRGFGPGGSGSSLGCWWCGSALVGGEAGNGRPLAYGWKRGVCRDVARRSGRSRTQGTTSCPGLRSVDRA